MLEVAIKAITTSFIPGNAISYGARSTEERLVGDAAERLKDLIRKIVMDHESELIELEIMSASLNS